MAEENQDFVTKRVSVYTKTVNINLHVNVREFEPGFWADPYKEKDGFLIFEKLSGNSISFIKENVVVVDVQNYVPESNATTE